MVQIAGCHELIVTQKNPSLNAYPSKDEVDKTEAETGNERVTLAGSGLSEDCRTVERCLLLIMFASMSMISEG
jgi:hypothetical protein